MVQVIWSQVAKRSLAKVHDFVAQNDPEAAQRVVRSILVKSQLRARFPQLGAFYRDDQGAGLRVLLHGHYRIFYKIVGQDICVHGVYHERMDVSRHLKFRPK